MSPAHATVRGEIETADLRGLANHGTILAGDDKPDDGHRGHLWSTRGA